MTPEERSLRARMGGYAVSGQVRHGRGQGVRTWFTGASETVERARAICGGCAVRAECVRYAMSDPDLDGVWAGLTAKERREMRWRVALKFSENPC